MSDKGDWARRLIPAAVFQGLFVGAVALLKPAANALVLARFQAGAMPYLYLFAAASTGVLSLWASARGSRRWGPTQLSFLGGLFAVVLYGMLRLAPQQGAVVTWIFIESLATSVALSFWGVLGEAFDAREARSAFTRINGVGMVGAIAFGLLAQPITFQFGAAGLWLAGGVTLVIAAVAFRFHRSALAPQAPRPAVPVREAIAFVRGDRYARGLSAVVLTFSVVAVLADFVFRERAGAALKEEEMAAVFASSQTAVGVFCVVFQLFLAERLLRRLGLLPYLLLVPGSLSALGVLGMIFPNVGVAWSLKLFEGAASLSVVPVAMQLLYAPLPDAQRDAARAAIDGLLRKAGLAIGGLLLLPMLAVLPPRWLPLLLVGVGALAVVSVLRLKPRYLEALHARVAGAKEHFELEEAVLVQALRAPTPERVLRALELLEAAGADVSPHVRQLLLHPHERVQERGVKLAVKLKLTAVAKELEAIAVEGGRRPRDEAIHALALLAPQRAAVVLPPLLALADVGHRAAAIAGLLAIGPNPGASRALEQLLARGADAPVIERREVARLLGRLAAVSSVNAPMVLPSGAVEGENAVLMVAPGQAAATQALKRYLEDGDATVRKVAIASVGEGQYLELLPRLLRFLTFREDRRAARDALAQVGEAAVPLLAMALDDRSRALQLRYQLPRVLRQVGTPSALDALLFSNVQDDAFLHYRIGVALSRLRDEHPEHRVDGQRVREALQRRRATFDLLAPAFGDLKAALGEQALLVRAVGDRIDQALELSCWLLGLLHDAHSMRRAHAHLTGGDQRRRAWALEFLENQLEADDLVALMPLLHSGWREAKGNAGRLGERLSALCQSDDFTLRACARAEGRKRGVWQQTFKEDDMADVTLRRLLALEGVEIFAQSDVDDLAAVAAVAKEQSFASGTTVYQAGDPGDALFVILQGQVELRRDGELILACGPREAFGDASIFDGSPRVTDAIAVTQVNTMVIDRRDFLDLLSDRPELLKGVFRAITRQLNSVVVGYTARKHTGELSLPIEK